MKGKLVSQNDDFVVLETGGDHYLLPGSLELKAVDGKEKATPGNMVSVTLPAGNGEIVAELPDKIVLHTEHGVAQLPSDALTNL